MSALDELRRAVDVALVDLVPVRRALAEALVQYAAHAALELVRTERDAMLAAQGRAAALAQIAEVFLAEPASLRAAVGAGIERHARRHREYTR